MNVSELASKMLQWEAQKRALDALADEIIAAVLELGKTQVVGKVRATYSQGRKTYDYKLAAMEKSAPAEVIAAHTTIIPATESVDWRGVCTAIELAVDEIPYNQSSPSVTLKLEEKGSA